jgi:hypothetical protein
MLNAIDAMKDTGGELTITSQPGEGAELRISVSDTGVGLPTENPDQIFDSYRHHQAARHRHGSGDHPFDRGLTTAAACGRPPTPGRATFLFTLLTEAGEQRP